MRQLAILLALVLAGCLAVLVYLSGGDGRFGPYLDGSFAVAGVRIAWVWLGTAFVAAVFLAIVLVFVFLAAKGHRTVRERAAEGLVDGVRMSAPHGAVTAVSSTQAWTYAYRPGHLELVPTGRGSPDPITVRWKDVTGVEMRGAVALLTCGERVVCFRPRERPYIFPLAARGRQLANFSAGLRAAADSDDIRASGS